MESHQREMGQRRALRMEQGFGDPAELQKAASSCLPGWLGAIQPQQSSASAPTTHLAITQTVSGVSLA